MIQQLLDGPEGWRGSRAQAEVAVDATRTEPGRRTPVVAALVLAWQGTRCGRPMR